jgi:hypothetical protein
MIQIIIIIEISLIVEAVVVSIIIIDCAIELPVIGVIIDVRNRRHRRCCLQIVWSLRRVCSCFFLRLAFFSLYLSLFVI